MSDLEIYVIDTAPYKDPDEFMKYLGKERFNERIKNAETRYDFEIRILHERFPDNKEFKQELAKIMMQSTDIEIEEYKLAYTNFINSHSIEPEIKITEIEEIGDNEIKEQINQNEFINNDTGNAVSDNLIDFNEYEFEIGE